MWIQTFCRHSAVQPHTAVFVTAASHILSYFSAQSRSRRGAELRFIRQGFEFGALGRLNSPTCFRLRRKRSSVTSLINTWELKGLCRLDVPRLRKSLLNRKIWNSSTATRRGRKSERWTSCSGFNTERGQSCKKKNSFWKCWKSSTTHVLCCPSEKHERVCFGSFSSISSYVKM